MIDFDFDRAKTRRRLATHKAIVLGFFALMLLSWGLPLFHVIGQYWACALLVLILFVAMHLHDYARWVGVFWRGLRRQGTAVIVDQDGVVDNASDLPLGQLAWAEIEEMYPWDWKTHLLVNKPPKMLVLTKERGVVIILKDEVDFEPRFRGKPWISRSAYQEKFGRRKKRWLFIPDALLTVTADELMCQLNAFYIAEVRGTA